MKYVIGALQLKLPWAPVPFNPALLVDKWFAMRLETKGISLLYTKSLNVTNFNEHNKNKIE